MAGIMRIAASTYLNSAPLVYGFARGGMREKYEFIGDAAPARCAAMLEAGECEIALIPVIEYQRIGGLAIVPGVSVASKGRVKSVLVASRKPLGEVERLALDTSSRTSQALVRILFLKRFGRLPEIVERTPDAGVDCENMLESCDAALVIGDPAMRLAAAAREIGVEIYDLAAEWRMMTGLPFVFAVWAVAGEAASGTELAGDFLAAKAEGVARLDDLAAEYSSRLGLPQDELRRYLSENVNYDLDEENIEGLRTYFRYARECGLIREERELRFLNHGPLSGMARAGK